VTGPLLTARAVAELLDVTPATVLRWTRQGSMPAITLPSGQLRYRSEELDVWLQGRATPTRGVLTAADDAAQTVSSHGLTAVSDTED
jgi:excisionase family DNA binding protein